MNIVILEDHVAQVDTDAEQQFLVFFFAGFVSRNPLLNICCTFNSVYNAAKLNKKPIAHCFNKTAQMFIDGGFNNFSELTFEAGTRSDLINSH